MLANLPITRSAGARTLFLTSAAISIAVMLLANGLPREAAVELAPIFIYLFSILDYQGAVLALLILIAAIFVRGRSAFGPLLLWTDAHIRGLAVGTIALLCIASRVVYHNHPFAMDEYAALFQSRVFAAGHLAGCFPAALRDWLIPGQFQNYFFFVSPVTGEVASCYWPSFSLLLTPFTFLGIPWACNPTLSGLTLVAIHRLARRIFADPQTAGLAVLLTLASPVFFANGISYYSMPAHLLANAVYALLLIDPTPRRALLAGLVGSIALTLHNPVPHMLFAAPWLLATARRPNGNALTGWLLLGYIPLCLLLGLGWFEFATALPHIGVADAAAHGGQSGLERVGGAFALPSSGVWLARLIGLAKVWVWAVPGMMLLAAYAAWTWRHNLYCRLLVYSAVATLLGFLLVPTDQGHGWGFRYFHSAWMVLPLLAAAALTRPPGRVGTAPPDRPALFADPDTRTYLMACTLLTLIVGCGLRAAQIHDLIAQDLRQIPAYAGTGHRVVIVDPSFGFYAADLVQNDPWLRGDTVLLISRGRAADASVMHDAFPRMHLIFEDLHGSVWSEATVRIERKP